MQTSQLLSSEFVNDGHPCEAALEFRRILVRCGAVEELPADVLHLAISYAWIGKAVSRTSSVRSWLEVGVDPNTWQFIRAMAISADARRSALETAINEQHGRGFADELAGIRSSIGFTSAKRDMGETVVACPASTTLDRLACIREAALRIEGPLVFALAISTTANVVRLDDFRG